MSSSKSKKKSKSTKIPEPIKIKKEDDHLICPMEHYVDDRVELIRQIFSSLKPKTITNLAPDFLKKNSLESIQQECLNEILGISKKRLLSVINSTKCPTDTETSSEDDVDTIAEHISLEEISSDSDIAESKPLNKFGKKKKKVKEETGNNKQYSVLELLELQARARAIRSQLALEPVTKIEVDTDSEEDGPPKQKPPSALAAATKKSNNTTNGRSETNKSEAAKKPSTSTLTVIKPNNEPVVSKRIKLKRNFRKQTREDDSSDHDNSTENVSKKSPEKIMPPKEEARSPSPDVVTIVTVPETLCISDSDEEKKKFSNEDNKAAMNDDAEFLKAFAKSSQQLEILSVVNIRAPKKLGSAESEEEGEIVEEEEVNAKQSSLSKQENNNEENTSKKSIDDETSNHEVEMAEPVSNPTEENKEKEPNKEIQPPVENVEKPKDVDISAGEDDDDDDNDDVISLEGGDLVNEMKEHMKDEDVEEIKSKEDIICLDDSSEEEAESKKKTESWNDRWLNSRRVSKVLAASRLGNKVRKKAKESKKAKKLEDAAAAIEKEKEKEKPQQVIFISKHELGSVEQYKEILESLPKKTTD